MEYRHQYDEIMKHFGEGQLEDAGAIQIDLQLHNVNIAWYYADKYAFWLDFLTIDDNKLHGWVGRRDPITDNKRSWINRQIILLFVYIPGCSKLIFQCPVCPVFKCCLLIYGIPKNSS